MKSRMPLAHEVGIAMAAQIENRSDTGNLHLWGYRRNLPSSNQRGMDDDFVCGEV